MKRLPAMPATCLPASAPACASVTTAPAARTGASVTRVAVAAGLAAVACASLLAIRSQPISTISTSHGVPGPWKLVSDITHTSWQGTAPRTLQDGDSLSCPTVSTCYARVAPSPPGSVSAPVQIEVTHDAGASWQEATLPGDITQASGLFGSIDCLDANTCLTLGANAAGDYLLVVTTDGGKTWQAMPGPSEQASAHAVSAMSCSTVESCVVVGAFAVGTAEAGTSAAEITADGGQTWTQAAMPAEFSPYTLQCLAGDECITAGLGGDPKVQVQPGAAYSTDGGYTWTLAAVPAAGSPVTSMSCGNDEDCLAMTLTGVALATTDGGQAWTEATSGGLSPASLLRLSCATGPYCWGAGALAPAVPESGLPGIVTRGLRQDGQLPRPVLAVTSDQGRSWRTTRLASDLGISAVPDVSCPSTTTCFGLAVGERGFVFLSNEH